ncbi:hypothetical protein ACFXHA_35785 [Nocardia sp. NPDC059240]|uniref:hypothetical protein n=1 Tax=Nocardia sp. NPDC059240 TaxID=3346786 RepID=UPI0036A2540B
MTNSSWIILPSSVTLEMVRCALAPLGDSVSYYDPDSPTQLRIEYPEPWPTNDRMEVDDDLATIDEVIEDMPEHLRSRIPDPVYFILWQHGLDRAEEILSTLARSTLAHGPMIIAPHGCKFYEPAEYLALPEKW